MSTPTPQDIAALKLDIARLNDCYRAGQPEISDEQYDAMLDELRGMIPVGEYGEFVRSLTEPGGDVILPYVVGSLKKIKYGENQLSTWMPKHIHKMCNPNLPNMLAMSKIDGMSFVARYINGRLSNFGATRGDGYNGVSIIHKLAHILPHELHEAVSLDVRGELTLTGDDHAEMGMKNRRNGTVGLINRDDADVADLKKIHAYVYQIKAGHMATEPVYAQLKELRNLGFETCSWNLMTVTGKDPTQIEEELARTLADWKERAPYSLDGVVICSTDYVLEPDFLPEGMVSFKVNQGAIQATVTGIEWNVSKNGLLKPVVLVTPTDIDGTTVSRVTGYNAQWLLDNGIGEGASVGIIKSGEIIPKIVEVYETAKVVFLGECPSCGTPLDMIGVDLCCDNEDCGAAGVKTVESFLSKLDIEGAKAKTLESLGIRSMEDLLTWTPDTNYKGQRNLWFEIEKKVFNAPAGKLFAAMRFDGFGRKMVGKLIDFYGSRHAATGAIHAAKQGQEPVGGYPEGFTQLNMNKAADSWFANLEMTGRICADPRYKEPAEEEKQPVGEGKLSGKSFLFTGTLSMNRKQAEKMVAANGGTIASSVSKTLAYLVAGESAGSKLEKANKLGVEVLSEQQFIEVVA